MQQIVNGLIDDAQEHGYAVSSCYDWDAAERRLTGLLGIICNRLLAEYGIFGNCSNQDELGDLTEDKDDDGACLETCVGFRIEEFPDLMDRLYWEDGIQHLRCSIHMAIVAIVVRESVYGVVVKATSFFPPDLCRIVCEFLYMNEGD